MSHEVVTTEAEFLKISTNTFGSLRFKTSNENEAVKLYADQISTDHRKFTAKEARELPGFKVVTVKDKQRCLKPLQKPSSETSSKESPTP
ncbi:hypothetical protein [Gimesia panareensis]|uniref:hypothetical protein n=1 Tax=Gimesia panareensis TaxID=2527978 RepID=UPI0011A03D4D|nr:hypothetical protein [Gimesia panareensis]